MARFSCFGVLGCLVCAALCANCGGGGGNGTSTVTACLNCGTTGGTGSGDAPNAGSGQGAAAGSSQGAKGGSANGANGGGASLTDAGIGGSPTRPDASYGGSVAIMNTGGTGTGGSSSLIDGSLGTCNGIFCGPNADICTAVKTDVKNCGVCDNACPGGITATCTNGVCGFACPALKADCNGDPSDGCETDLTAEPNCGWCGRTCGGDGCTNGLCTPQHVGGSNSIAPLQFASDGPNLYWIVSGLDGQLGWITLATGAVLTQRPTYPYGIAADSSGVYLSLDGNLVRTDSSFQTSTTLDTHASSKLAQDADYVYYASGDGSEKRINKTTSVIETVVPNQSATSLSCSMNNSFVLDADFIYLVQVCSSSYGGGNRFYLVRAPKTGASTTTILKELDMGASVNLLLAVGENDLFYTQMTPGATSSGETNLERIAPDGSGGSQLFWQSANPVNAMKITSDSIYWIALITESDGGLNTALMKGSLSGKNFYPIATDIQGTDLFVGDNVIYYGSSSGIMSVPK